MPGIERPACAVCDEQPICVAWTDTHGVAQCTRCGTPYRVIHYEDDKRVDKPMEVQLKPEAIPIRRRYWAEHQRPMPGGFSFGPREQTQEVATRADFDAYKEWRASYDEVEKN